MSRYGRVDPRAGRPVSFSMHRCGRVILCLVLGAVTAVAVAWVLAVKVVVPVQGTAHASREGVYRDPGSDTQYSCCIKHRPGLTAVVWEPPASPPVLLTPSGEWVPRVWPVPPEIERSALPRWAQHTALVNVPGTFSVASARGWPARALWYEATFTGRSRDVKGGVMAPGGLGWLGPGLVLPGRPIVGGLVFDTLFYAALWYGALLVPGSLRRSSRWRGGRCTWCGYDLAHGAADRCPECGRERQVPLFCREWRKPYPSPWSAPDSWAGRTRTPG